jgi:peroxiredoxin
VVKKIFSIVLPLILVQNFLFAASPLQAKTGELAINFNLLDLEDQEISLSEFRGMPVILFFWTTWCPFCREELKQLNLMHRELSENGMEVLAINVEERAEKVQRFIQRYPFSYKVLLDKDATVARDYGILGVPTYIFIDKESRIVSYSHYFPQEKYNDIISK